MNVVVLGATSDIARELSIQLANRGDHFVLAARDAEELEIIARDVGIRTGVTVSTIVFDAENRASVAAVCDRALERLEHIDGVIVAFGYLGDQERARREPAEAARIVEVNLTAAIAVIEPIAVYLEARGAGWILGLSSIAGVRGRQSDYIYGAAKAGLTTYLEGLAHRLSARGVRVKIAKLGFVSSRMTRGSPMPAWAVATPAHVARRLVWLLHSPLQSAYIPWRWWPIMTLIRLMPATLFNRAGS